MSGRLLNRKWYVEFSPTELAEIRLQHDYDRLDRGEVITRLGCGLGPEQMQTASLGRKVRVRRGKD